MCMWAGPPRTVMQNLTSIDEGRPGPAFMTTVLNKWTPHLHLCLGVYTYEEVTIDIIAERQQVFRGLCHVCVCHNSAHTAIIHPPLVVPL